MRLSSRYILACLMVAIMLPMVAGCRIQTMKIISSLYKFSYILWR